MLTSAFFPDLHFSSSRTQPYNFDFEVNLLKGLSNFSRVNFFHNISEIKIG